MAIAHVQDAKTNGTTALVESVSLTGVGAGHLLSLSIFTGNGAEVASVIDSAGNYWIRGCLANASGSLDNESWYASGVAAGTTAASVTLSSSPATDFTLVMIEFSGVSSVNAMDQEVPNAGVGTAANTGASVQGFTTGTLFISTVTESGATLTTPSGFTSVTTGRTYDGVAYLIDSGQSMHNPSWTLSGSELWLTNTISFTTPQVNAPLLNTDFNQFPQIQVEWSPASAPFTPVWRNVARYVRSFKTTQGRQHQLDRIEAGSIDITFDGRDGTFNPWNTSSFLFNNFQGMQPMNPIRITAAWQGITYYVAYGYMQSLTPTLADAVNVDVDVKCWDILQFLSLRYLSGNNYATLIQAETTLCAYWRLGDSLNSFTSQTSSTVTELMDSTPITNAGYGPYAAAIINGPGGYPLLGAQGVLLYDADGALDLTNGTNAPNGGFGAGSPLSGATSWSVEMWLQWTDTTTPGEASSFTGNIINDSYTITGVSDISALNVGDTLLASTVTAIATINGLVPNDPVNGNMVTISVFSSAPGTNISFTALLGGVGATIFTTTVAAGELDLRLGYQIIGSGDAQTISYNRLQLLVNGTVICVSNAAGLLDGNWHHVVVTFAESGGNTTVIAYLDGTEDAGLSRTISANYSDPVGTVVGCNAGAINGFPGILDEVALYNSALVNTDIVGHYQQGLWFQSSGETGANMPSTGPSAVGRLNHVLAVSGFGGTYAIGSPYITSVYGEVDPVTTTTCLDYIQILMETEPGIIFAGQDGNIYALNRQYVIGYGGAFGIMNSARAAISQGIFGDTSGSTYRFEYKGFDVGQDDLDIWNDIQAKSARPGTPAPVLQEVNEETDSTGIALLSGNQYGVRTLQGLTNLLFVNDSDALAVAQQYLVWYAAGLQRAPLITIQNTSAQGANIPQMLGRNIYDRLTIQYQGQTAGAAFSQDSLIESIEHDVDVSTGIWATSFAQSPYEISKVQISAGGQGNAPVGQLTSVNAVPIVFGTWTFGTNTAFLLL